MFKKIFKILTNRVLLTIIFFLLQLALLTAIIVTLSAYSIWIYVTLSLLSVIVCIFIMSKDNNPGYKLAWIFPIMVFPLFGGLLFIFFGRQTLTKKQKKLISDSFKQTENLFHMTASIVSPDVNTTNTKVDNYVFNESSFPLLNGTKTTYYKIGEEYFEALKTELLKAEKFIFMEYFIIEPGKMWNSILEILVDKVKQGVDVRVIYDDVGCLFTLPNNYYKKLNELGIKSYPFNKIKPTFDIRLNNRTHRKIVVIDGNVSFTGGLNLADEYINEVSRFGHWKDTGMMFCGLATWSFTIMFLRIWMLLENSEIDYTHFVPNTSNIAFDNSDGYVQPLAGGPGQNIQLIENTFMQIFNTSKKYVYITTPYLILDNEIVTSLCLTAKSGVDVRIIMPHVPDKKMVFMMSRSFYPVLLKAGVKIFEYTPGFMHAKSVVSDDEIAFIGTCNMDYRSFYLHYECGAILYNTPTIADMKKDFLDTLEKCHNVTLDEATNVTIFTKLARSILRLFAPLL